MRNFVLGGTTMMALSIIVIVALFAAVKGSCVPSVADYKANHIPFKVCEQKADGPYASVEHFCEAGMCSIL